MPIYEFKCAECKSTMNLLVQGYKVPDDLACEKCGSGKLKKIITSSHYHQSDSARVTSYNPGSRKSDSFYRDTRNIGLHAEHMLRKAGVQPTEEFKSKLERLRTDPSRVIKDSDD
jgi:putative FmdB family regulatory protein